MKFVAITAALFAVVVARPGSYKENEEFKYARSSTDEGSKSGFYEAQRGNVGGNYEKAHNMDNPAQKTMSQAIQQVDGAIGDSARFTHGDVYNSGSSKGAYSQAQYDLSNLQGRNFQEGGYHGEAASHSALNSGYNSQSAQSGYGSTSQAYTNGYRGNNDDNLRASNHYNNGYHESGKESAYHYENSYGGNHLDNSGGQYIKSGAPLKLTLRPGTTQNVPLTANIYQDREDSSYYKTHSANQKAVSTINTEVNYPTQAEPKHYESSYEYKKQWEKQYGRPASVPVPIPNKSELHDDNTVSSGGNSFRANDFDQHNAYRAASKSQSQHQSEYIRQGAVNSNAGYNKDVDTSGLALLTANIPSSNPEPKKYDSSYSYHKSWERQGDPYVIRPEAESQQLSAGNQGYGSYASQYGSQHRQSHSSYRQSGAATDCNCDEEQLRVRRSVDSHKERVDPYQQSQVYEGQQVQSENLEDFGQETQSAWDLREFSQQSGKLEDLGQQQTEDLNSFNEHGGQNKWDKENLSQQKQSRRGLLSNFDQQSLGNVNNFQRQELSFNNLHRDLELPHETPKSSLDSNENPQKNVGTELLSANDTQQTQDGSSFSDSMQKHFRPISGSDPFPTHYLHDGTQNREQSNTMHGYNQNAFESSQSDSGLQNHKQISNSEKRYTAHSYGYEYDHGQNGNVMINSNNENSFRSQWQPFEDRKTLGSDFEKSISTTPKSRNIFSGLGRGDIGADDVPGQEVNPKTNDPNKYIFDHTNTTPNPLKTPEEIEALSQTKPLHNEANGPNTEVLGVLSVQKHNHSPLITTTTRSKLENSNLDIHETQSGEIHGLQQNIEQQSTDFGQEIQTGMTWEQNLRDFNPNQSADHQRDAKPRSYNSHRHQTPSHQSQGSQQNIEQQSTDSGQEIQIGMTWEESLRDFNPNQSADLHHEANPQSYTSHRHQTEGTHKYNNGADNLSQQQQSRWVDGIQESNQELQSDLRYFNPNDHKPNTARVSPSSSFNDNSDHVFVEGEKNAEMVDLTQSKTEKPGFWKSVGNKLVSAKDKVSSWFNS